MAGGSSFTAGASKAPMRRRRFLFLVFILVGLLFFFGVPWELPLALKDAGLSGLSRANVAQFVKSQKPPVHEIYGLLHLVTEDHEHQHVLSNAVDLDPSKPVDMSLYAAGNTYMDWHERAEEIDKNYPIIVFSKSYCPFSRKAKTLLETYDIEPSPLIIEVDLRDDSNAIKLLLTRLTGHSTFPNIVVRGKTIGGSDNLQELHENNNLAKLFKENGATAKLKSSD